MFCGKCGAQIEPNNTTICPRCGNSIPQQGGQMQQPLTNNTQVPPMPDDFDIAEEYTLPTSRMAQTNPMQQQNPVQQTPVQQSNPVQQPINPYGYAPVPTPAKQKKSNTGLIVTISICSVILIGLATLLIVLMLKGDILSDFSLFPDSGVSDTDDDDDDTSKPDEPDEPDDDGDDGDEPIPYPPEKSVSKIDNATIESIVKSDCPYTAFGIYVYNKDNGYEYTYNGDKVFLSSAMGQVVILNTLSLAAEEGAADVKNDTLYFDYMPNGKEAPDSKGQDDTYVSLKECVEDVAVYGDNNKSNHIVDYIGDVYGGVNGFTVINNMLEDNGYVNTQINRKTYTNSAYIDTSVPPNVTTPSEIGSMFNNLIFDSAFGNEIYMKNIFKSISNDGKPIGIKKYVADTYDVCNVNALTSQCTNNVAVISDGEKEIVVALLSETVESQTKADTNEDREKIQQELINYIVKTQFENHEVTE